MSSLVLHDHPPSDTVRVVALAATIAVNAVALLSLTLPSRPAMLLMPALGVDVTAVLIDPPVVTPPPPLPEPPPLPASAKPLARRVAPAPAPTVVPPVAEAPTIAMPIAPPVVTPAGDADSGPDSAASGNGVMQALAYASRTDLRYPAASLRAKEQGDVLLRILVNTSGQPERIEIARSSGYPKLDRAARESVQGWTFRPVLQNGVATPAWGLVPVSFHLDRG